MLVAAAPACRPAAVGSLVVRFLDAFNRGDTGELAQLVASEGSGRLHFKWYSSAEGDSTPPPRRHVALYSTADFFAYVAERHQHRERLRLMFARSSTPHGREVAISFVVRREADDLPEHLGGLQRVATGKAAFDCGEGRMVVWSMGMHMAPPGAPTPTTYGGHPCPVPSGWRYGESPPVVCWHGPNAPTARRTFRPASTPAGAPPRCSARSVAAHVGRMLAGYNFGLGLEVAQTFSPNAVLSVGRDAQPAVRGRRQIAKLASGRYMLGEGWTAVTIVPASVRRIRATYRLTVQITDQGRLRGLRQVSLALDCRSGLITRWAEVAWESSRRAST